MKRKSLVLLLALSLLFLTSTMSFGHDWYSAACCSGHDCHPIDSCTELVEKTKGYIEWNGYTFSPEQVHPSEDSKCHVCIHQYPDGPRPLCVYTQQGS